MPESTSASKSGSKVSGDWSQNLCPSSKYSIKAPYSMEPIGICMHNTANSAPASNEISYMNSNNNQVSFHLCVDEKEAIQGLPFNRNGWHAGDGGSGQGNRKHIGIEIARSTSSDANQFAMAEKRAAAVVAKLLQQYGWGISNIKAHRDFASKDCPHRTNMTAFKEMVKEALDGKLTTTSTTGAATTETVKESAASGTAKVTCDVLNVRQGPGTNYSILGTLTNGKTATIQAQSGNWYKISYGGGSGWISKDYVTVSSASSSSTSKPSSSSGSSTSSSGGSITEGSKVKITGSNYATGQAIPGWVKSNTYTVKQISGNRALIAEIISWVYLSDLQLVGGSSSSSTTSKPSSSSKPSTSGTSSSGSKLDQLLAANPGVKTNQDLINLFYKLGGNTFDGAANKAKEYGVDINALISNRSGKVSSSSGGSTSSGGSSTSSTSTAYVTCDVLNVRSGAGTGNSKIGSVTYGTKLTVLGESSGWYKIQYGSGTGWVCASYTSKNNPSSGGGGSTTTVGGIKSDSGFAKASYNVAMSMGGYKSQGLCATGVSRAIKNYYGYTVWGNGNQIDDNLPKDKFKRIDISLSEALKIAGLILTWEATSTKLGAIYGHTAITQGNGMSSSCDFYENNTRDYSGGRSGFKCFVHK